MNWCGVAAGRSWRWIAAARHCAVGADALAGAAAICGRAEQLPLADGTFDLVFCQFALVWLDGPAVAREVFRVLQPGGVLAAIEPDYGGMIEHPPEIATRDLWMAALAAPGPNP